LSPTCVETLRRHRAKLAERRLRLGPLWNAADGDVIFHRGDGAALHPDSVKNALDRFAKKAGVPRIRVHDMRHTMATLGLTEGVHPKII
jgi:integrase